MSVLQVLTTSFISWVSLVSVFIDETNIHAGGFSGPRTEILEFDGDEWNKVGDLTEIRNLGAATAVDLEKIEFCK